MNSLPSAKPHYNRIQSLINEFRSFCSDPIKLQGLTLSPAGISATLDRLAMEDIKALLMNSEEPSNLQEVSSPNLPVNSEQQNTTQ